MGQSKRLVRLAGGAGGGRVNAKGWKGDWQILARWIDETLPYSSLFFFPALWAVNVSWHERPQRRIDSYAVPKGRWR